MILRNKILSIGDRSINKDTHILVTGGAGFIGSHIIDSLMYLGCRVTCLDNLTTGKLANVEKHLYKENFEFIEGDIRDFQTCIKICKEIDMIVHLAAIGNVPRSLLYPQLYHDVNVTGSLNIFEAARQNGIKLIVYASSSSVYGSHKTLPKVEDKLGLPQSPYAESKSFVEQYAKMYNICYGVKSVGLRYFNVFGPRQLSDGDYAAVVPKFIKLITKGEDVTIYGSESISRDFTFVDNVVYANILALQKGNSLKAEIFNVGCGESITLEELFSEIKRLQGTSSSYQVVGFREGDIKHSLASIEKSRVILGYTPIVKFNEGIKETLDYWDKMKK